MPETIRSGRSPIRPELGEAHAVDRRAVGRVADGAVVEAHLLDPQRAMRVVMLRAVALRLESGAIDVQFDVVDLCEGPPQRVKPVGPDAVVIGEQDPHRSDSMEGVLSS